MKQQFAAGLSAQQGDALVFSDFETDGEMWAGEGDRERKVYIEFNQRFRRPPIVNVAIKMIDVDQGGNLRYDLIVEYITEKGFDVRMKTWGDTKIARASVNWTAIGPSFYDGDWEDSELL